MDWNYEILAVFILLPIVWGQMRNNQKNIEKMITQQNACSDDFKAELQKFYELFAQHTVEDNQNFKLIARSVPEDVWKGPCL